MNGWELNPATILAILVQIVGFTVFIVRADNKAAVAKDVAAKALVEAEDARVHAEAIADRAHKRADDAHLSVAALSANLSLFREQVAANYVDREALREIKQELLKAIEKLGDRMDESMKSSGHK